MDTDEIVDDGLISYTIYDDYNTLIAELDEKEKEIKNIRDELDDTNCDLEWANSDICRLQEELQEIDTYEIQRDAIYNVLKRMRIDNILTPELESWFDDYFRFYCKDED